MVSKISGQKLALFCAASALGLLVQAPAACAQEAPKAGAQLEELVVTAQRRSEAAQQVPISMTVLSAEAMSRFATGNELGQSVPNVQIEQTSGFGIPRIGIRGIAQNDSNASATTSNMVYLDEVPLNATIAQGVLIWDLERAEVLRGPQGTLFGRNATGGAIRYISKMPGKAWEGYADVGLGHFGQREVHAAVGGPVTDNLGLRVAFVSNHTNGDVYNVTLNEEQDKQDYYGVRGILDWKPTDAVSLVVRAQYFNSDIQPMVWKTTPGVVQGDAWGPLPNGETVGQLQASFGYKNLGQSSHYTVIESDMRPSEHLVHIPVSVTLDWNLGPVTLTSVSAYLDVKHSFGIDNDASPLASLDEYDKAHDDQWTQEVRLASNGNGPFKWIAGAFYMHEHIKYRMNFDATEWRGTVIFPDSPTVMYTRGIQAATESWAGFLHTTYDITPKLMITAAARYTWEEKRPTYTFRSQYNFPTSVPRTPYEFFDFQKAVDTGNLGQVIRAAEPSRSGSNSWTNLSWKLALDYKLDSHNLLYGLISRGFKGGAFPPTSNTSAAITDASGKIISVPPETVTDFEVGAKSDIIPGRLRLNGSVYYYDYRNYQTNQFVAAAGTQVLSSLPKARLMGAELEMEAVPLDGLHVNLGLGVANTKITKALDPTLQGNKLPLAEDFNSNGSVRYDIETPIGTFSPEISAKYRGRYYTNKDNDVEIGGYTIFNARIGYESANSRYYGAVWVKNIGDIRKPVAIDDATEFFGGNIAALTARRTYGLTLGARF